MRRLKALPRLLLHAVAHNPFQSRWDGEASAGKLGGFLIQDCGHGLGAGVVLERTLAIEHFVQNAAETENVRAMVRGVAPHLFRRHVADGPQNLAGVRFSQGDAIHGLRNRLRPAQLRQAEIQDLQPPISGDEDVLGFKVTVNDSLLVGRRQTLGKLNPEFGGLAHRHPRR